MSFRGSGGGWNSSVNTQSRPPSRSLTDVQLTNKQYPANRIVWPELPKKKRRRKRRVRKEVSIQTQDETESDNTSSEEDTKLEDIGIQAVIEEFEKSTQTYMKVKERGFQTEQQVKDQQTNTDGLEKEIDEVSVRPTKTEVEEKGFQTQVEVKDQQTDTDGLEKEKPIIEIPHVVPVVPTETEVQRGRDPNKPSEDEPSGGGDPWQEKWKELTQHDLTPPSVLLSIEGSSGLPLMDSWPVNTFQRAFMDSIKCFRNCYVLFNKKRTPCITALTDHSKPNLNQYVFTNRINQHIGKVRSQDTDVNIEFKDIFEILDFESQVNSWKAVGIQLDRNPGSHHTMRVPVSLIVFNGDLLTLEHVARAVRKDISVTLIKGSGGAADLIDSCINGLKDIRKKAPPLLGLVLDNTLCENIERAFNIINEKCWLVNTFDLKSNNMLSKCLTDGILNAWASEDANIALKEELSDTEAIFNIDVTTISKHIVNIEHLSRNEFFGCYWLSNSAINNNDLQDVFLNALLDGKFNAIKDLLEMNVKLTEEHLAKLYSKMLSRDGDRKKMKFYNESKVDITFLLMKVDADAVENLTSNEKTKIVNRKKERDKLLRKLVEGTCKKIFGLIRCHKCCRCRICKVDTLEEMETDTLDFLVINVLKNEISEARLFWCKTKYPLYTALISSCMLRSLSEMAEEEFEDKLKTDLFNHSE